MLRRLSIAAMLALALLTQSTIARRTTSAVWDESIYLTTALQFFHHGIFDGFVQGGIAPLPVVAAYWLPAAVTSADRIAPEDFARVVNLARLAHAVIVGLPFVLLPYFWMARRRGLWAGAAAGALLVASPTLVAFSSFAVTDACYTICLLGALWALAAHLEKPSLRRLAVAGLVAGLALSSKYSAIVLMPIAGLALILTQVHRDGRWVVGARAGPRALGAAAIYVGLALTVVWALHGFSVDYVLPPDWRPPPSLQGRLGQAMTAAASLMPLPTPFKGMVGQALHARSGQSAFLLGQRSGGWWYYFPLAWLFKSTPAELLMAVSLPFLVYRTRRTLDWAAWLGLVTLGVVAGSVLTSRLDIGVRLILPVFPLVILAAVDRAAALGRTRSLAVAGSCIVALQVASAVAAAPGYLSYFNRIFTPAGQAHTRLADSNLDWGQDLPALGATLRQTGAMPVLLAYFGSAPPEAYGIEAVPWDSPDEIAVARCRFVAVSATLLDGAYLRGDPFARFRDLAPDARPAESLFVYARTRPDVEGALAEARASILLQRCRSGAATSTPEDPMYAVMSHWWIRCMGR